MNIFFQTFVLSYTVCFYRTDGERAWCVLHVPGAPRKQTAATFVPVLSSLYITPPTTTSCRYLIGL